MKSFKVFVLGLMTLALLPMSAWAGPEDGELFGYKIGDRYPANDDTQAEFFFEYIWVIAEKFDAPEKFGAVKTLVTPQSFVIGAIRGEANCSSEEEARHLSDQYARVLHNQHGGIINLFGTYDNFYDTESPFLSDTVKFQKDFDGKYRLEVRAYTDPKVTKEPKIEIWLQLLGEDAENFDKLRKQETEKLLLDAAKEDADMKGLE